MAGAVESSASQDWRTDANTITISPAPAPETSATRVEIPERLKNPNFRFILIGNNKRPVEYFYTCATLEETIVEWENKRTGAARDLERARDLYAKAEASCKYKDMGNAYEILEKAEEENKKWQRYPKPDRTLNYSYDDPILLDWIKHGNAYGILGGFGNLAVVDEDKVEYFTDVQLPGTFTVHSRPGRPHHYYITDKPIATRPIFYDSPDDDSGVGVTVQVGDLKAKGGYVVAPGSIHPDTGGRYEVAEDIEFAHVTEDELLSSLGKFKIKISRASEPQGITNEVVWVDRERKKFQTVDENGLTLYDSSPFADLTLEDVGAWPVNGKYEGNEVVGEHPLHGSESKNKRNFTVSPIWNLWHCWRCSTKTGGKGGGGDPALFLAQKYGLLTCEECGPGALTGTVFIKTWQRAFDEGLVTKYPPVTLNWLLSRLEKNPAAWGDNRFLRDLGKLSPLDLERFIDEARKEKLISKSLKDNTIKDEVARVREDGSQQLEENTTPTEETPVDHVIKTKAEAVINEGRLPEFWVDVFNRRHDGDDHIATSMLVANVAANVTNSTGIAVIEVNGESGDGKSHAVLTAAEQMGKWCDISGLSHKALLYHGGVTIREGMMVVLDDNRPDEDQADVIKRNQTNFKKGYSYKTVDAQRKPVVMRIPACVQILTTEVDAKSEDEQQNRTLMLEAKGDLEKDLRIISKDLEKIEMGEEPDTDPDITVCQTALDILKAGKYKVVIPNASKRLKWLERGKTGRANLRNYHMFKDMIFAFAVMRYHLREHRTLTNGVVEVIATKEDFDSALNLYMKIHKQMRTKLTTKGRELIEAIQKAGGKLLREDAIDKLGVSDGRLSQIINGKSEKSGLKGNYPGFYTQYVNENVVIKGEVKSARRQYLCLTDPGSTQIALNNELVPVVWMEIKGDGEPVKPLKVKSVRLITSLPRLPLVYPRLPLMNR